MVNVVLDTNILIYFLGGVQQAREEIARHREPAISVISWMEVLVGVDPASSEPTRLFLDSFFIIQLDAVVATRAVALRRLHRLKIPDAIIRASADVHSALLVTRNTRDFSEGSPGIHIPCKV